jgi:acyl carrier protein
MDKNQILSELNKIFQDLFQNPAIILTYDTDASDIDEWDSLNHATLVSKVEKHFKVKFELMEMLNFKNVGNMCDAIGMKING